MDGQEAAALLILDWIWVPMAIALVWTIKRLLGLEKNVTERRGAINTKLAVLATEQNALKGNFEEFSERNEKAHERLEKKIDSHHKGVMDKLDKIIANGK